MKQALPLKYMMNTSFSQASSEAVDRFSLLLAWLEKDSQWSDGQLTALAGDASFRRYYRWERDHSTAILMDAPPPQEDIRPFVSVQKVFSSLSVSVPKIHRYDVEQGFAILQDFGDRLFSQAVTEVSESVVDDYYKKALTQLSSWQTHVACSVQQATLPLYDQHRLLQEMQLLPDWLLNVHLETPFSQYQLGLWQDWQAALLNSALSQPKTLVHRDYHSRNLMVTEQGLGVIDFQDAVQGSLTYDAVSLLRDAYLVWPEEQVMEWLRYYFLSLVSKNVLSLSEWQAFVQAFDWMGLQRHIKVLGIFARLAHRDHKVAYLQDLPVVASYVHRVSARYPQTLVGMADWVENCLLDFLVK